MCDNVYVLTDHWLLMFCYSERSGLGKRDLPSLVVVVGDPSGPAGDRQRETHNVKCIIIMLCTSCRRQTERDTQCKMYHNYAVY